MTRNSEKGQIAVTVALLLAVMLGFAALAADMGFLYSSRTGSQAIVDAAALAGAASFIFSPKALQPDTAEARALATATAQDVLADAVLAGEVNVNVDVPNQLVTVTMDRTEETFFARVLGIDQAGVRVAGSAEAALNASGADCTKPWFLPNTILMDTTPCLGEHGQAQTDCYANLVCGPCALDDAGKAASELLVYADSSGNFHLTAYAVGLLATTPPLLNVRPTRPADALAPGQFYSIRLGDSTGGNDYRTNIGTCTAEKTYCGHCYDVEPGVMMGPTNQGVDDLLGANPDDFFWDASTQVACFGASAADCSLTSPQLVLVPIWDVCNSPGLGACPAEEFCGDANADGVPDAKFGGLVSLRIVAYAVMFIDGWSGTNLQAHLIDVKVCDASGPATDDNGNLQTGPLGVPLRLVHPTAAP